MIKRILVALSGTPFTPTAVRYALELGRAHDAEVTGVTLLDMKELGDVGPVPIGGGPAAHALAEHRLHLTEELVEEQITKFEVACREAGIDHATIRETGAVGTQFVSHCRYHDLMIIGLRGLFKYGVVDKPDDKIMKLMSAGVRSIFAVAEEYRPIKRVLIAYSGSMESAKTMKRFIQARFWTDVQVKVVTFDREDDEPGIELVANAGIYCRRHGVDVETECLDGDPPDALLEHAETWNADLIVMGSTRRSKLAKLILGDTTLSALKRSDLPIFLSQ